LAAAAAQSPEYGPARWHQGYVKDDKRGWLKFDEYLQVRKVAATLAKYERERELAPDTVQGQLALADWCAGERLAGQERAHLTRVIELAPDHAAARQRLGFVRQGDEWVSRLEVAREQAREAERRVALARWRPVLLEIRKGLEGKSLSRREHAAARLSEIHDPAAVAAIEDVFNGAKDEIVLPAIDALAGISGPAAAASLVRFAVHWPTAAIRDAAARKLSDREKDDYVPQLVGSMSSPILSRFVALNLPSGRIGYRHAFVREREHEQSVVLLDTEYLRVKLPGGSARASTAQAYSDAASDAQDLERQAAVQNRLIAALNERLAWVLRTATGVDLPADPLTWWTWWNEHNDVFVQGSKPVSLVQRKRQVSIVDQVPDDVSEGSGSSGGSGALDCLAAGTPVWTSKGLLEIEQVRLGDLVLSQHPETGELAYKPVLRTTVRPVGKLTKIRAGGETFQTSGGHLFWVAGEGWKRARDLTSGHVLHAASGPVHITTVESGAEELTYNLVVADFATYFVGESKLLSHDNTIRTPTRAIVPGLRAQ
jgi:hypothetical protein